jgi:hypothetical protein
MIAFMEEASGNYFIGVIKMSNTSPYTPSSTVAYYNSLLNGYENRGVLINSET